MKILIHGYGRMGAEVERVCRDRSIAFATIDPEHSGATYSSLAEALRDNQADAVCIDFSVPRLVPETIETALGVGLPLVIGTTGWYERTAEFERTVTERKGSVLYAANFSVGVNLFARVISHVSSLFSPFEQYDVAGFELHHRKKIDFPSGTAEMLAQRVIEGNSVKTDRCSVLSQGEQLPQTSLNFGSVRVGSVPGTHTVIFDSEIDSVELTHRARSRAGFAHGAVDAAQWLQGRRGFFSIDALIDDKLDRIFHEKSATKE